MLELGAGLGLCSVAAKLFGALHVISTDLPSALPYITHTASLNHVSMDIQALDWTQPYPIQADLILLSDVVWVETLIPPLLNTLKMLLAGRGNRALMCYKLRSNVVDEKFRKRLEEEGMEIREIERKSEHLICEIVAKIGE